MSLDKSAPKDVFTQRQLISHTKLPKQGEQIIALTLPEIFVLTRYTDWNKLDLSGFVFVILLHGSHACLFNYFSAMKK